MLKVNAPVFLGKVCVITGGSFKGIVCMPQELSYCQGDWEYSCLTLNVDDMTVDVENMFAWVDERDLELHSSITNLDGFQFYSDDEEE